MAEKKFHGGTHAWLLILEFYTYEFDGELRCDTSCGSFSIPLEETILINLKQNSDWLIKLKKMKLFDIDCTNICQGDASVIAHFGEVGFEWNKCIFNSQTIKGI